MCTPCYSDPCISPNHVYVSVSKLELVSWLQHQIAEQKRIDATTSGAPVTFANPHTWTKSPKIGPRLFTNVWKSAKAQDLPGPFWHLGIGTGAWLT